MKSWLVILGVVVLLMSGIPMTEASSSPVAIASANWYSENSTLLVAPGYSYVPLVVTFVAEATLVDLNVSLNYSVMQNGYFGYSYVHGVNGPQRDYFTFPEVRAGSEYEMYQMTNISPNATSGLYQITMDYSFIEGNVTVSGNVTGRIALLGTVDIAPQESYFGLPGSPIASTSFESNVPVTVYFENNGNSAATNVTISYTPQSPMSGLQQEKIISAFPAYQSIPLTFTVNTGASGTTVVQEINITVFGVTHHHTFTIQISAFPYIVGAGASFNAGSVIVGPGMKNVPLTFYLEEDSSVSALNVSVSYTPSYPLSGTLQSTILSAFPQFTSIPVTFLVNVSGTQSSFYQNLTLTYNGSNHLVSFKIIMPGYSNISLVNYFTTPPFIYQNQGFIVLKAIIINGGNTLSPHLNVSLTSNDFIISTSPYSFPSAAPGVLVNVSFLMNASNHVGPAELFLHINNKTVPLTVNILSKGSIDVSSSPITAASGSNSNLFKFVVMNSGKVTLVDINIHILTPDVFYIDVPSSNPLGALTANNITFSQLVPGQSLTVTFVMDVESAALNETYPSQLFVTYRTNNSSVQFLNTYNFNVTVQQTTIQQISSGIGLAYIVLAASAIIIVVFVAAILRRRRRKKK